jgi:hypothetical protein
MYRVSGLTYRISIRVRSSSPGTLALRVSGYDVDGHLQRSYLNLPLH